MELQERRKPERHVAAGCSEGLPNGGRARVDKRSHEMTENRAFLFRSAILGTILALFAVSSVLAGQGVLSAGTAAGPPGTPVPVSISLASDVAARGVEFTLQDTPDVLTATGCTTPGSSAHAASPCTVSTWIRARSICWQRRAPG